MSIHNMFFFFVVVFVLFFLRIKKNICTFGLTFFFTFVDYKSRMTQIDISL